MFVLAKRIRRAVQTFVHATLLCYTVQSLPAWAAKPDPKGNDCTESYWRDSLRCVAFPAETPQPNYDTVPAATSEIKDYTRVFLTKLSLRALDGTRPILYVDKAVCTDIAGCSGTAYGDPIESNKWLISVTGGGSCEALDTDADGKPDDASSCTNLYEDANERDEMGTATKEAMKNFAGIMSDDPATNPVFAGYNRVRVEKVSYDRYNGIVRFRRKGGYFAGTTSGGMPFRFDLYQQGFRILKESLRMLEKGLSYASWREGGGSSVEEFQESLPSISEATTVVFIGHSGGAHGLYHNIDRLAAFLARKKDFVGDVRAIFDANFLPGIANESAFATDAMGTPLTGDLYADIWTGTTSANGITFSYDGEQYYADGALSRQYDAWGGDKILDKSCLKTHKQTDGATWKCRERMHVLANHIATPFFFREDFSDPNVEHTTAGGIGHFLAWGEFSTWPHCPVGEPCPPYFNLTEHRSRLTTQAETLLDQHLTASEIALGIDESLGIGLFPTHYAWMPNCNTHSGAYSDDSWNDQKITWQLTEWSMRSWVQDFLTQPRTGVSARRIDGVSDGSSTAISSCPP